MTPQSAPSLLEGYHGIVCDLDGVVYAGPSAIPHAVEALEAARGSGRGVVYATNNGSRPPAEVAAHLAELGLTVTPKSVVTSAQAAAALLLERLGAGAPVLAVGGPGVPAALTAAGLRVVTTAESASGIAVRGVLQSYGKDVCWSDLAEISYVVNAGALWVASNTDLTIPTARGVAPGNGTLVRVVRTAVDIDPLVVGKPHTPLYDVSARVLGTDTTDTLAIGDRLDTDIEGANRAGIAALMVFTGVNDVADVALAPPIRRPRYLGTDLRVLSEPYVAPQGERDGAAYVARCGAARARIESGSVQLSEDGSVNERLRALVAVCWAAADGEEPPQRAAIEAADPLAARRTSEGGTP